MYSAFIYAGDGTPVGYFRGDVVYTLAGHPAGRLEQDRVYRMDGGYVGTMVDKMVVVTDEVAVPPLQPLRGSPPAGPSLPAPPVRSPALHEFRDGSPVLFAHVIGGAQPSATSAPFEPLEIDLTDLERSERIPAPSKRLTTGRWPWMHDPGDFSELPPMPSPDDMSEAELWAYLRKHQARTEAEEQIDEEVQKYRLTFTSEEREREVQERAGLLANTRDAVEWEFEREDKRRHEERVRHAELVSAIERAGIPGAVNHFAREHPFLAGVLAADVASLIKRK